MTSLKDHDHTFEPSTRYRVVIQHSETREQQIDLLGRTRLDGLLNDPEVRKEIDDAKKEGKPVSLMEIKFKRWLVKPPLEKFFESQPELGEGWGKPAKALKMHYFVDGMSLCRKWGAFRTGEHRDGWQDDHHANCIECSHQKMMRNRSQQRT